MIKAQVLANLTLYQLNLPNPEHCHCLISYHQIAKKERILSQLKIVSLISLRQLADNYCASILTNEKLRVIKEDEVILEETRNHMDGLYDIPIYAPSHPNPKTTIHRDNFVLSKLHSLYSTHASIVIAFNINQKNERNFT